jgi:hypothetical protein
LCRTKEGRIAFLEGWPKVTETDEKGLPREVYPLAAVRVEKSSCPANKPPSAGAAKSKRGAGARCDRNAQCESGACTFGLDEAHPDKGVCEAVSGPAD